jgi:hypothetical protein
MQVRAPSLLWPVEGEMAPSTATPTAWREIGGGHAYNPGGPFELRTTVSTNRVERKMKLALSLLLAVSLMLPIPPSVAQAPPESRRPPDGGTRQVLVSILIPSVPNAPFSATVVTEWIRQLADGSTITLGNRRAIARDKAGRIFQERRLLVPNDGKQESIVTQIEISDPVAHDLYICVPQEHVCQVEVFSPPEFIHSGEPANFATRRPGSPTLEDLGKQSRAGLETEGTRETTVIESGAIGNDTPIMVRREYWYSPQLSVNIISKLQDPRVGTQSFEVSDIVLGEPDAQLFKVPGNSKVIDLRKSVDLPSPNDEPPN